MNEKRTRLVIVLFTAALHVAVIFLIAFDTLVPVQELIAEARVMQLLDLAELPPPPPVAIPEDVPVVEAIAEVMIEVEVVPEQTVVAPGTLVTPVVAVSPWDEFLPAHRVSAPPSFDQRAVAAALVFPPQALRAGIEGRVMLELFVDRNGIVQHVRILREEPEGRGFGEAAQRVFLGRRGTPAMADGGPVAARFRYPISFRIR